MNTLKSQEILDRIIEMGIGKGNSNILKLFILGILGGSFIAFAAEGSNMAAYNLFAQASTFGIGKFMAGCIFATGLVIIVLAGGELFTGNSLMVVSLMDKKIKFKNMMKNWVVVYIANFLGSILIAYMIVNSGLLNVSDGLLGAVTVRIASYKVGLDFVQALILGILCNWIVCLAIWISTATENMAGKILGMFFPIMLFATSGFEHSVANMYYIPAGILAKSQFGEISGLSLNVLNELNWSSFFLNNLLPVTIGNVIGGVFFVGMAYYVAHKTMK